MDLKDIGFYTLSDERARSASKTSPLMRCELILTDQCNFKCPYCRGPKAGFDGIMPLDRAKSYVDWWAGQGLKNIRFSGGEPTAYYQLLDLVKFTKESGIERIAISTNGSAKSSYYIDLIEAGVNDISISFDACCAAFGDKMAGGIPGAWERVVQNVKILSQLTYVTLGIVVTEETVDQLEDVVKLGAELGAQDLRIISAAQYNELLTSVELLPSTLVDKYPILKYRVNNIKSGRNVRGIQKTDSHKCPLVLDDMLIIGDSHFPCVIYAREHGEPIGKVTSNTREDRYQWYLKHDTHLDSICKINCLDVCVDYSNKYMEFHDTE
jgi:hypothetical protein